MLKNLEEAFKAVRKSVLSQRGKIFEEKGLNPKGEASYSFDLNAEKIAIDYLKKNFSFPIKVISEEIGEVFTKKGTPKYTVIIDPVDGSTNFKRGMELSFFSIAVLPADKPIAVQNVEFALIGNIFTGSVWKAQKGKGCFFNNKKAKVSRETELEKALVGIDTDATENEKRKRFFKLLEKVKSIRRFGSACAELSAVAIGAFDAHVDIRDSLTPENFMAAYLLIKEAGGVFTDARGNELSEIKSLTEKHNIVAAGTKELHAKIIALIGF